MKPDQPTQRSRVKVLSAVVGGSAIVAMAALTVAASELHGGTIVSDPATSSTVSTPTVATGGTTKSSTPEATETVSPVVATPPVTATSSTAPPSATVPSP